LTEILTQYQQTHPKDLVQIEGAEPLPVVGERTYLQMMLHNLLNNALKYGNGEILVTTKVTAQQVCISIHDDGAGIPESQWNDLFKPFVRGEDNQNSGYGMGLAIVERIALWHGGCVEVQHSDRLGGANFTVFLPSLSVMKRN
jgi:signal transduction histidine kinase